MLTPLPYHRAVVELLQREEPDLWRWHAEARPTTERTDAVRLELLKSTYRLAREAHADLYQRADRLAEALGVIGPLTCYQANSAEGGMNATLWYVPDEAHVVFHGPLLESLDADEVDAVIAHELGHHHLWSRDGGCFGTADRLLGLAADDTQAEPSHLTTFRRWRLATELFADRAALVAGGDLEAAVRCLVRIQTGATKVHGPSYLSQATEVLANGRVRSAGVSHPECFIRAAALAAYQRGSADLENQVEGWLAGPLDPADLDLPGQHRCTALTRRVLTTMLGPAWMRTDAVLAHARQFFPDIDLGPALTGSDANDPGLNTELAGASDGLRDYICALVLDLAMADRDLGEVALAHAYLVVEPWGWQNRLTELIQRDLKLKLKELARLRTEAASLVAAAAKTRDGAAS